MTTKQDTITAAFACDKTTPTCAPSPPGDMEEGKAQALVVEAASLIRKATPEEEERQRRAGNFVGFAYSIVVGIPLFFLVAKYLGAGKPLLGSILGWVLGAFYGLAVIRLSKRRTGISFALVDKPKNPTPEHPTATVAVGNTPPPVPLEVTLDPNQAPPPQFLRRATPEEAARNKSILCQYAILFFPLGVAPLLGLISWRDGFLYSGVGCLIGYTLAAFNAPALIGLRLWWCQKQIVWIHTQGVWVQEETSNNKETTEKNVEVSKPSNNDNNKTVEKNVATT